MIKTQREYEEAKARIEQDKELAAVQRRRLEEAELSPEEIERGMEPLLSFHAQLVEEVEWYERIRERDFTILSNLSNLGRLLIALRIANGLTQRELARRLEVNESQISRDERNEYYGITLEKALRILEALGETVETRVKDRGIQQKELALAG